MTEIAPNEPKLLKLDQNPPQKTLVRQKSTPVVSLLSPLSAVWVETKAFWFKTGGLPIFRALTGPGH